MRQSPVLGPRGKRSDWLWLLSGTIAAVLAEHGTYAVPVAAWLFCPLLLRFTRNRGIRSGTAFAFAALDVASAFWVWEAGFGAGFGAPLALCFGMNLVLMLPFTMDRLLHHRFAGAGFAATLVFPLARAAAEFGVATLSPIGGIMGSLAQTQHDNLPLLQLAAITGGSGISFLIAWCGSIAEWAHRTRPGWPRLRGPAVTVTAVIGLVLLGGSLRVNGARPDAPTVQVATIGPSPQIKASKDFAPNNFSSTSDMVTASRDALKPSFDKLNRDLIRTTEERARAGAGIIVWSEAATVVFEDDKDALLSQVATVATRYHVYVDVGVGIITEKAPHMSNQAILVDPSGEVVWAYDKAHPVPGMEFYPGGPEKLPTSDSPYGKLANVICFDADFPALMRQDSDVDIMMVPAEDWLGFDVLHSEKAAIRAVENGYNLIRSDDEGTSMAFDYEGRLLASADYYTSARPIMIANVPTEGVHTIYGTIGDTFAWLCVTGLAALAFVGAARRKPETAAQTSNPAAEPVPERV